MFVRTFYTGIDSAGIYISEIITISASRKEGNLHLLLIVEGRGMHTS